MDDAGRDGCAGYREILKSSESPPSKAARDELTCPNIVAAICAEMSQSRLARPASLNSGLLRDIRQLSQYSPVTPAASGLAAKNAGVAARCAGDLVKCRSSD